MQPVSVLNLVHFAFLIYGQPKKMYPVDFCTYIASLESQVLESVSAFVMQTASYCAQFL